jgi:hypothetical protein
MMTLCLYLVEDPTATGYDVWDKWVVAASSRKQALHMHPDGKSTLRSTKWSEKTTATYLGKACVTIHKPQVICASFNAG